MSKLFGARGRGPIVSLATGYLTDAWVRFFDEMTIVINTTSSSVGGIPARVAAYRSLQGQARIARYQGRHVQARTAQYPSSANVRRTATYQRQKCPPKVARYS